MAGDELTQVSFGGSGNHTALITTDTGATLWSEIGGFRPTRLFLVRCLDINNMN